MRGEMTSSSSWRFVFKDENEKHSTDRRSAITSTSNEQTRKEKNGNLLRTFDEERKRRKRNIVTHLSSKENKRHFSLADATALLLFSFSVSPWVLSSSVNISTHHHQHFASVGQFDDNHDDAANVRLSSHAYQVHQRRNAISFTIRRGISNTRISSEKHSFKVTALHPDDHGFFPEQSFFR
jgi:hypothetical protein